ncbi:MAG: 4-hydroxy-tetrahydrodipicolinate reductase [Oscillospiraceae bacterium]|nr:4-hydroxy-tetrahydrodipicolinate reductase [Oscillospiraceae bacterium]
MTRIALSGALGKMGRVITELVNQRGDCRIVSGIDVSDSAEKTTGFPIYRKPFDLKEDVDVIIDFSHPSALPDLLTYCKTKNLPLVAATTGYNKDEVSNIKGASTQIPVFFTGNMSLGINLLQDLARRAVRVLGEQFDIEIIEKHHNLKKDAPSGTSHMLAESINDEFKDKRQYIYDRHNVLKSRSKNEIGMHAVRGGTIVGEHEIIFAGHDEVITISHSALSKEVFAVGAINAALFLKSCHKGLYDMSDLLKSL